MIARVLVRPCHDCGEMFPGGFASRAGQLEPVCFECLVESGDDALIAHNENRRATMTQLELPLPAVCECHADSDIDGIHCPRAEDDYEGPETPCHESGKLNGSITCDGCDWKGTW